MLSATPEDRVVLWKDAVDSDDETRHSRLRLLAREAQEAVAASLELYSHDDMFEETFELLGATGLYGRDALRIAFEEVDQTEDGPARLVEALADLLDEGSDDPYLAPERRDRSLLLAGQWRAALADLPTPADMDYWSVAEVAKHFAVTPQAVYRWIDKDRIQWRRRPGGSYLIPTEQFRGVEPFSPAEASVRPRPSQDARLQSPVRRARREQVDPAELVDPSDPTTAFTRRGSVARRRPLRRSAQ